MSKAEAKVQTAEIVSLVADEHGRTSIHNQVVSKIAGLAVQEIEGVHKLVPFGAGQAVSSLAKTVTGSTQRDIGVKVEVGQVEAAVDVRIITTYGASIPAIADAIRRNVSDRIEHMTGLRVTEVNVDVADLYFDDDVAFEDATVQQNGPRVH